MNWIFRILITLALFALAIELIADSFGPIKTEICSEDSSDEHQNPFDSDTDDDEKEEVKYKVKTISTSQTEQNNQSLSKHKNKSVSSVYHFPNYSSNHLAVPYSPPELI